MTHSERIFASNRDRHYIHVRVPLFVQQFLERLHVRSSSVYMTFESFERSLGGDVRGTDDA